MINDRYNHQYKFLPFLAMLIMVISLCHLLFMSKTVMTNLSYFSSGSLIIPFYSILFDIIAEIYGIGMAMKVFWCENIIDFLLCIIFKWLCCLTPIISFEYNAFGFVFAHIVCIKFDICALLFCIVSYRINGYLLIKLKILMNGKYFCFRSIFSSYLGELIFLTLMFPTIFWFNDALSIRQAINLTFWTAAIKLMYFIIFAFPGSVIVNFLKIIEKTNDLPNNFNPFKEKLTGYSE